MGFLSKIADGNKKEIKRLGKLADKVLDLEEDMSISVSYTHLTLPTSDLV